MFQQRLTARLWRLVCAALICVGITAQANAATISVPLPAGSELLREQETPLDTLLLPTGPVSGDDVPTRAVEGRIHRRSWRIGDDLSPLEVLTPIRTALENPTALLWHLGQTSGQILLPALLPDGN